MKRFALLLLAAPALFAQTADLRVVSLTTDKSQVAMGGRYTISMRWGNDGPDAAQNVVARVGDTLGNFVVTGAGTSGWPCEPSDGGASFICRGSIAPGAEAGMVVTMLAPPNDIEAQFQQFVVRGTVATQTTDPNLSNNSVSRFLDVVDAPSRAELSITPETQTHRAAAGARVRVPLAVRNTGPAEARDLILSLGFGAGVNEPLQASGEGWSCANPTHSPWLVVCSRDRLEVGATAPLVAEFAATTAPLRLTAAVRAEGFGDNRVADNSAIADINPAAAPPEPSYERILIPLTGSDVPGVRGALWRTETTALIASNVPLAILPAADRHLGRPYVMPSADSPNGVFLHVPRGDAAKVRIDSRVYDVSRSEQTAGAEIPIVREGEFTSSPIAITGIPLAPHYRHTLRVYDRDGRGGRVAIRIYGDAEQAPRVALTGTLALPPQARRLEGDLPSHPAYLQLDPAQVASLAGASKLRIDVEPLDDGLSIWAFISVTNNETHHVTTFSAQ